MYYSETPPLSCFSRRFYSLICHFRIDINTKHCHLIGWSGASIFNAHRFKRRSFFKRNANLVYMSLLQPTKTVLLNWLFFSMHQYYYSYVPYSYRSNYYKFWQRYGNQTYEFHQFLSFNGDQKCITRKKFCEIVIHRMKSNRTKKFGNDKHLSALKSTKFQFALNNVLVVWDIPKIDLMILAEICMCLHF